MDRPQVKFDINMGTIITIVLASIGGIYKFASIEGRIDQLDQRGQTRILLADKSWADQASFNKSLLGVPDKVSAIEATQAAQSARMDRFSDVMLGSQDAIKKDIGQLSTKLEVQNTKMDALIQGLGIKPIGKQLP